MRYKTLAQQFFRFILVGSVVALIQFSILFALVQYMEVKSLYASSLGFVISAVLNYILNYTFTFRSKANHRKALARFLAVASVGLVLNGTLMKIGTDILSIHYIYSQIGAIACVIIWNFFANRKWTFSTPVRSKGSQF
jgi:putative flippase GtrA